MVLNILAQYPLRLRLMDHEASPFITYLIVRSITLHFFIFLRTYFYFTVYFEKNFPRGQSLHNMT